MKKNSLENLHSLIIERIALLRVKETVLKMKPSSDVAEKLIKVEHAIIRLENERDKIEREILESVYGQLTLELKIENKVAKIWGK